MTTQILTGLFLGIACGLFFGEECGRIAFLGDAFVGLLRMAVLPYIGISLVVSLGRLTWPEIRRSIRIGGCVLLVLWAITLLTIAALPSVFPPWKSGSFFSSALIENAAPTDLLSYFIPANIFESLSENQVPAVILFCIFCGIGVSQVRNRAALLEPLEVAAKALLRVSEIITRLAPIGIFAIAADTAGTASLSEIVRLQAYLVAYAGGAVFLGFIVLPLLVTTLTPLSYRQVFQVAKEPMLTAMVTGKLIIVLPMLVQNTERLLRKISSDADRSHTPSVDGVYAIAYPFPHAGKLLSMLFIPFVAWFLGNPLEQREYPQLLSTGLFSYFGGPLVAIPFLLDQMRLPHDMFQLFLISGVFGERLGDAVGAIHLTTLTLISIFGFRRKLRFSFSAILKYIGVVSLTGLLILIAVRYSLYHSIAVADQRSDVIARMQLLQHPVDHSVIRQGAPNPDPLKDGETLLQRIRRRGVLRVGYNEDKMPFAFFNSQSDLVGYDIDMAHALARDLKVSLEFVRFDRTTLESQLNEDHFDVVMSGLVGTLERSEVMQHTTSYMDLNLALVVPDYRTREFKTLDSIRKTSQLRIGFVDLSRGFEERLRLLLPEVELVELKDNLEFFHDSETEVDALLMSAETGSFFAITHPEFEVVVPKGLKVKLPLFYAIANQDAGMREFLQHWISLREKDGTSREYYDHWIRGITTESRGPRWSVIRDVLHWQ